MGFLTKARELVKSLAGSDEFNIDEINMSDEDIQQVIMIDPKAEELLKVLSDRKKYESKIEEGFNVKAEKNNKERFKKFDPETEKAKRAMHNKVANRNQDNRSDREIGE